MSGLDRRRQWWVCGMAMVGAAVSLAAAQQANEPGGSDAEALRSALLADIDELVIGLLCVFTGLVGLVTGPFVWRRGQKALFWFGMVGFLYGTRMLVNWTAFPGLLFDLNLDNDLLNALLDFVIPGVFFLFAEALIGSGYLRSIRRMWQVHLLYAVVAGTAVLIDGQAAYEAAKAPYLAIVFIGQAILLAHIPFLEPQRRHFGRVLGLAVLILSGFIITQNLMGVGALPWTGRMEHWGVAIFFTMLGYMVVRDVLENSSRLAAIDQELRTARSMQESILPAKLQAVPGLAVFARYSPMTEVAGDYYNAVTTESGALSVIVADVSGHGVPAALVGSMVKVAYLAQAGHLDDPARALDGINEILTGGIGSSFLTASSFVIDPTSRRLTHAGAGHPPLLVWRRRGGSVTELPSTGPLIGVFTEFECQNVSLELDVGDRVLAYTDGIVEAKNDVGEFFGTERLKSLLARLSEDAGEAFLDALHEELGNWSGTVGGFEDDVTVVFVDVLG